MNAEPGSAEMEMISHEGFRDAWREAGEGMGYTFSSDDPVKRIDWLWHSDDLTPVEIGVIQTQASDHMPVQARFLAR
jgi:endonuclease/exonuclease/phosphatase (EEP) superfamily protein YafD